MDTQVTGKTVPLKYVEDDVEFEQERRHISRHHRVSFVRGPTPGWQLQVPVEWTERGTVVRRECKYFSLGSHGGFYGALAKANQRAEEVELAVAAGSPPDTRRASRPVTRWSAKELAHIAPALALELRRLGIEGEPTGKQFKAAMIAAQTRCLSEGTLKPERARDPERFTPARQAHMLKALEVAQLKLGPIPETTEPEPAPLDPVQDPPPPQESPLEEIDEPTEAEAKNEPQFGPPDIEERQDYNQEHQDEAFKPSLAAQIGRLLGDRLGEALGEVLRVAIDSATEKAMDMLAQLKHEREHDREVEAQLDEDRRIDELVQRGGHSGAFDYVAEKALEPPPARVEDKSEPNTPTPRPAQPRPATAMQEALQRAEAKAAPDTEKLHPVQQKYPGRKYKIIVAGLNPHQKDRFQREFGDAFMLQFYFAEDDYRKVRETARNCDYAFSTFTQAGPIHTALRTNIARGSEPKPPAHHFFAFPSKAQMVRHALLELANGRVSEVIRLANGN